MFDYCNLLIHHIGSNHNYKFPDNFFHMTDKDIQQNNSSLCIPAYNLYYQIKRNKVKSMSTNYNMIFFFSALFANNDTQKMLFVMRKINTLFTTYYHKHCLKNSRNNHNNNFCTSYKIKKNHSYDKLAMVSFCRIDNKNRRILSEKIGFIIQKIKLTLYTSLQHHQFYCI